MTYKNKSIMTKRKAFTLIELLIVIAIIGILFIVLVSKVDFATDKAKATGVQTDFRSFQLAFETVSREHAGFNTFGWDTGDVNANGKRDSYDEGDVNKDGKQDTGEVWTGHKVYAETFTKVFSLVKPGTTGYDRDALNRLETAINANLDPKLHITIADDGTISMANGAQDPWNKEYHGWYITNAEVDKKDRGAIVMYSDGANNEFGSEHTISNGVVTISIPGSNKAGKDDYGMVVVYTYVNGYGEIKTSTSGFSNNQGDVHTPSVDVDNNGSGNLGGETSDPSEPIPTTLAAGFYDANDNVLATWEELVNDYGMEISTDYTYDNTHTIESSPAYILEKYFPTAKTIVVNANEGIGNNAFRNTNIEQLFVLEGCTTIGEGAFGNCESLISVSLPTTVTSLEHNAFYWTTSLDSINFPTNLTNIGDYAFYMSNIREAILPVGVTTINAYAFADCSALTKLEIPGVVETKNSAFRSCTSLKYVKLGSNLKTLGYEAFCNCVSLTEIELPEGLEKMDSYVFQNCNSLSSIKLPETLTHLGYQVLYQTSLEYLYVPDSVTFMDDIIGNYYASDKLKAISLPGNIQTYNGVLNCGEGCTLVLRKTDGTYDLEKLSWSQLASQTIYVPANLIDDYVNHFVIKDYGYGNASKFLPIEDVPEYPWFEKGTSNQSKLDEYTWAELKQIANLKLTAEQYKSQYGIELGQIKNNQYILVDFNNYDGFVFMYNTNTYYRFSEERTTNGGYASSLWVNKMETLYSKMDASLKSNIKQIDVICGTNSSTSDITTLSCHLFIPSWKEMGGTNLNGAAALEGEAFEYFASDSIRATVYTWLSANGWHAGGALRTIFDTSSYRNISSYDGSFSRTESPNSNFYAFAAFVIG